VRFEARRDGTVVTAGDPGCAPARRRAHWRRARRALVAAVGVGASVASAAWIADRVDALAGPPVSSQAQPLLDEKVPFELGFYQAPGVSLGGMVRR